MDGTGLFTGSSRAGSRFGPQRWLVVPSGSGTIWRGGQYSYQLGAALPREPAASSRTRSAAIGRRRLRGPHRDWLVQRCRKADFTLRGWWPNSPSVPEVDYRTVWEFVHAEKLSHKKRR